MGAAGAGASDAPSCADAMGVGAVSETDSCALTSAGASSCSGADGDDENNEDKYADALDNNPGAGAELFLNCTADACSSSDRWLKESNCSLRSKTSVKASEIWFNAGESVLAEASRNDKDEEDPSADDDDRGAEVTDNKEEEGDEIDRAGLMGLVLD